MSAVVPTSFDPSRPSPGSGSPESVAPTADDAAIVSSRVEDDRPTRAAPWVATTYLAEGLPYSMVHQVAAQLFTFHGASLEATGLTSLLGLPWLFKFLWSPVVDRVSTMRRWIVALELSLAAVIGLCAVPASDGNLGIVIKLLVPFAIIAATHDIAIDGFYLQALGKNDQASLSGFRVAAYRAALFVGNGVIVALAGWVSWRAALLTAAGLFAALGVGHAIFLPRPQAEALRSAPGTGWAYRGGPTRAEPAPKGNAWVEAIVSFVRQPQAIRVVAFLVVFRAGDALMFAMATPLMKDLGLGTDMRGIVGGGGGTTASIVGAILGGFIVARFSLKRVLFPIAVAQCAAIPIYAALALAKPGLGWIVAGVLVEQLIAGIGAAAFSVFILRRCKGAYKASHFATATAITSLIVITSGTLSGYIASRVGFPAFFMLAFVAAWPGVILARHVPTT